MYISEESCDRMHLGNAGLDHTYDVRRTVGPEASLGFEDVFRRPLLPLGMAALEHPAVWR